MALKQFVIAAEAGIQRDTRFPIKSGMTSMWKTLLLYIGLVYGMLESGIPVARADINIVNPLGPNTMTIIDLVQSITRQLTDVTLVIAVFAIIVVGFKFVYAAAMGDANGIKEARKNLLWVLIGTAVVVGAYALATAVKTFLSGL